MKKITYILSIFAALVFVAQVAFSANLTVSWDDNSSAETGFILERGLTATGPFSPVSQRIPANGTSFVDSGLAEVTQYFYRVCAYKTVTGGEILSAYSNIASGYTPLNAPSNNRTNGATTVVKLGRGESAYVLASK